MKIGILTYWQTLDNYGQVLQCYALQQVLKDMGHDPFVIRYDFMGRPSHVPLYKRIGRIVLYPIYQRKKERRRERFHNKKVLEENRRHFDEFRECYFNFSSNIYKSLKELKRNPPVADCYIAGSDQLWGQLLSNPENEAFYLSFGREDTRRISFAVSFGMKDYPDELKERLRKNLLRFDYVSCRERDGVNICKSVGIDAERVVDPTLICPTSFYVDLLEPISAEKPYIYLYSMNVGSVEDIRYSELTEFATKNNLHTLVTIGSGYFEGRELYEGVEYSYATIGQWLAHIKNASLVVTTSFHGTVFSILFHRPFVYVPLQGKHSKSNNRVFELLTDLGLSEHILCGDKSYYQLAEIGFNWSEVDSRLENLRSEAIEFLQKALKKQK